MVEALPPDAANQAFRISILPRAPWCSDHFLNLHPFQSMAEFFTVDLIPIPEQKAWRRIFGKCLDNLLRGPGCRRVSRDIEVQDLSAIVRKNDEAVQVARRGGWNREKVDRDKLTGMSAEERLPGLRGGAWGP